MGYILVLAFKADYSAYLSEIDDLHVMVMVVEVIKQEWSTHHGSITLGYGGENNLVEAV